MARSGTTLFIGISIGVIGVLIVQRLKSLLEHSDPDSLVERLSDQLEQLESHAPQASKPVAI